MMSAAAFHSLPIFRQTTTCLPVSVSVVPSSAMIRKADFLSAAQRRDIFYNNAAKFLRLKPPEIAHTIDANIFFPTKADVRRSRESPSAI